MASTNENEEYTGPETKGLWREVCCIPLRMTGKVAIVTGANAGIGMSITAELARRGAEVIMACRDMTRAQSAKDSILALYGVDNPDSVKVDVVDDKVSAILSPVQEEQLRLEQIDLSSLQSVREFADRITKQGKPINYLINNAGMVSATYEKSVDGHEMQLAVNYLGQVLLTELLLPLLKKAPSARIVMLSSMMHFTGDLYKPSLHLVGTDYGPYVAYSQSKLALTMYTVELAKRLEGSTVIPVCICPGNVATDLFKNAPSWKQKLLSFLLKPQESQPWDAAQQIIHALLRRELLPGGYYDRYERQFPDRLALTQSERTWLWEKTQDMLNLH